MGKRKQPQRKGQEKRQKYPQTPQAQGQATHKTCTGQQEGLLCFDFPEAWTVTKYDAWKFVKNDVGGQHLGFNGIKDRGICSVDFACIDEDNATLWLIEVKDFRKKDDEKHVSLWESLCDKLICSMSGLFAARYAAKGHEQDFAKKAATTTNLRFVLHLEVPQNGNKFENFTVDAADIQQKMDQKFSRVCSSPLVTSLKTAAHLPWQVWDVALVYDGGEERETISKL